MNIGELARQTGVSIRSLRYYETKQLLSSRRGDNGYRFYDSNAVERVKAIQFYLGLGLTTSEIFHIASCCTPEEIASLLEGADLTTCPGELAIYQEKLEEIEAQIAALEQARTYLKQRLTRARVQEKH